MPLGGNGVSRHRALFALASLRSHRGGEGRAQAELQTQRAAPRARGVPPVVAAGGAEFSPLSWRRRAEPLASGHRLEGLRDLRDDPHHVSRALELVLELLLVGGRGARVEEDGGPRVSIRLGVANGVLAELAWGESLRVDVRLNLAHGDAAPPVDAADGLPDDPCVLLAARYGSRRGGVDVPDDVQAVGRQIHTSLPLREVLGQREGGVLGGLGGLGEGTAYGDPRSPGHVGVRVAVDDCRARTSDFMKDVGRAGAIAVERTLESDVRPADAAVGVRLRGAVAKLDARVVGWKRPHVGRVREDS